MTERHWGIITVMDEFGTGLLEAYLPPGHRILATKPDPRRACCQHIIEGPDMPVHIAGRHPEQVDMLFDCDHFGISYAFWAHQPQKSWMVGAAESALVGD